MDINYIINTLVEFLLSMKWLWIFAIILGYRILSRLLSAFELYINIKRNTNISNTDYEEEKIIAHLDYIIQEALDYYKIMNIGTKFTTYINSKIENEILDYLADTVPDRLSGLLLSKLSLIYNHEYVNRFIAEHIYMIVTNFVLEFNTVNKLNESSESPKELSIE